MKGKYISQSIKEDIFSLQEANIDWKTDEKQFESEEKNIFTFGGKQKVINLQPNQTADVIFQENKGNGGDYTDEVINGSVW